jgi:hypothetical protein
MAENKTKASSASVDDYFSGISDPGRRADCEALAKRMARVTKHKPTMWGTSIVGFDSYHYRYESGREGDSCVTGFSSRKGDISIYLTAGALAKVELVAKLGKHKTGKGCLYVTRLGDIDLEVLDQLVAATVADRKRLHG